jgi:hypothetical protein
MIKRTTLVYCGLLCLGLLILYSALHVTFTYGAAALEGSMDFIASRNPIVIMGLNIALCVIALALNRMSSEKFDSRMPYYFFVILLGATALFAAISMQILYLALESLRYLSPKDLAIAEWAISGIAAFLTACIRQDWLSRKRLRNMASSQ